MKLTHLTTKNNKEKILIEGFKINRHTGNFFKPEGVWLSINSDWEEWLNYNDFSNSDDVIINVNINNKDKYLIIDSMEDFKNIFYKYCDQKLISARQKMNDITEAHFFWLWIKKQQYRGVILTSKGQIETKWKTFMYGWDCASICCFYTKDIILTGENNG